MADEETTPTPFDIKGWNELTIKQKRSRKALWEYLVSVIGEQDDS